MFQITQNKLSAFPLCPWGLTHMGSIPVPNGTLSCSCSCHHTPNRPLGGWAHGTRWLWV